MYVLLLLLLSPFFCLYPTRSVWRWMHLCAPIIYSSGLSLSVYMSLSISLSVSLSLYFSLFLSHSLSLFHSLSLCGFTLLRSLTLGSFFTYRWCGKFTHTWIENCPLVKSFHGLWLFTWLEWQKCLSIEQKPFIKRAFHANALLWSDSLIFVPAAIIIGLSKETADRQTLTGRYR